MLIPDFGKFYGGAGSDTFYMGLTSYGHTVSLPDFNPAEDNIILSPSLTGGWLTGYEINGNELTLTYHNTSYPGNESKIILPDGLDLTAVQNAITIDDPLPDWMEAYPTITHVDEYENNWQYDGNHISNANVIYDTRWDDHIKGSDNDQHIYLTHGNDIVDGAGEVILFISMNYSQALALAVMVKTRLLPMVMIRSLYLMLNMHSSVMILLI